MYDFLLSLATVAAKAFIKESVKALAKKLLSRIKKERTDPISSRDGSGTDE